jgi:hypothetical protein
MSANTREAGMMITTGVQGVGKTYQNMHTIKDYVTDKVQNKVRGRKCLIMDTNGEFTKEQFDKNGVKNFDPKRIALRDVEQWSRTDNSECRRIDAKSVGIREKKEILQYLLKVFRNGMLVIEDINTYILNVTHMEEIVGGIVNLRHRAVDVLVSYQSLRPVEPRMWQNARWIRMHHQSDNVMDIKGKVNNPILMKIAQLIVDDKYYRAMDDFKKKNISEDEFKKRKSFFVYIHNFNNKIEGRFTKDDFLKAAKMYLNANKKYIKEYKEMNQVSDEAAIEFQSQFYLDQYYGNKK